MRRLKTTVADVYFDKLYDLMLARWKAALDEILPVRCWRGNRVDLDEVVNEFSIGDGDNHKKIDR